VTEITEFYNNVKQIDLYQNFFYRCKTTPSSARISNEYIDNVKIIFFYINIEIIVR